MVKFIFEDNENTPSSMLLRSCYNGANVHFAGGGGASSIMSAINKCLALDSTCTVIVFFDLPPNNKVTEKNYDLLVDTMFIEDTSDRYKDVHLVPIFCIEFYILRFLLKNNYLEVSDKHKQLVANLITSFDYKNSEVVKYVNSSDYRKCSLEHVYKELLTLLTTRYRCMKNQRGSGKKDFHGSFYLKDCDCDTRHCKNLCRDTLKVKAEYFYVELPIFDVVDDKHREYLESLGFCVRDKDFKRLYDEVQALYRIVCTSMGLNVILVSEELVKGI